MSVFRAGLLRLSPWGIWCTKTAQFDLLVACERPVWGRMRVTKPDYDKEALCWGIMLHTNRWALQSCNILRPNGGLYHPCIKECPLSLHACLFFY